jgi:uncharacterized protein
MPRESKPIEAALQASAGRLQLQLFQVTSTVADGLAAVKAHLPAHLAYLATLEASGKLFMAGPLCNEDGATWSGDGLLIYHAADFAEAQRIAAADPLHASGARTCVIRPWVVNDGRLSLSLTLSTQQLQVTPP